MDGGNAKDDMGWDGIRWVLVLGSLDREHVKGGKRIWNISDFDLNQVVMTDD